MRGSRRPQAAKFRLSLSLTSPETPELALSGAF